MSINSLCSYICIEVGHVISFRKILSSSVVITYTVYCCFFSSCCFNFFMYHLASCIRIDSVHTVGAYVLLLEILLFLNCFINCQIGIRKSRNFFRFTLICKYLNFLQNLLLTLSLRTKGLLTAISLLFEVNSPFQFYYGNECCQNRTQISCCYQIAFIMYFIYIGLQLLV